MIAATAHIYDRCIENGRKIASSDKARQASAARLSSTIASTSISAGRFIAASGDAGAARTDPTLMAQVDEFMQHYRRTMNEIWLEAFMRAGIRREGSVLPDHVDAQHGPRHGHQQHVAAEHALLQETAAAMGGRSPKPARFAAQHSSSADATQTVRTSEANVTSQQNTDRIQTTHIGSLPRPHDLLDMKAKLNGKPYDESDISRRRCARRSPTACSKQVECGIDIVTDGEFSKPGFFTYIQERLEGFEARPNQKLILFQKEVAAFPEYYAEYFKQAMMGGAHRADHAGGLRRPGQISRREARCRSTSPT